jgi:hypothetical protein
LARSNRLARTSPEHRPPSAGPAPSCAGVITRRDNCRLCGGRELSLALPLTPAPIIDDYVDADRLNEVQSTYPMDVYLCQGCGHAQLLDVVDPQVLYGKYIYETTSSPGLVNHFQQYAEAVMDRLKPASGSLVVDIGSNDGSLLRFFKDRGMRVLGVDPAVEIARRATESGIETLGTYFTPELASRIRKAWSPAKIITANNLFANVDDLDQLTNGFRQLLDWDGVLVIETFYMVDLMRNMVFDFLYHEHLNCYTVKPLASFFARHGLELIDVQRIPTKGGSMRLTVQLAGGPRPVSPSVAGFIQEEERIGVHSLDSFRQFSSRIDRAKNEVGALLRNITESGKSVAGFGASATTTCMIYHFGIGEALSFLVDDNPAKQNRFSPGLHIPVYKPEELYQRKPDYVVVFAWRFAEAILENHRAYLDQGGHFIVPLPELRVV